MSCFIDNHGRPPPFWTETVEEWIELGRGEIVWEEKREGKLIGMENN